MQIGIPSEIKPQEGRVALIPEACGELVRRGHGLHLQQGAGVAAGYADEAYLAVGVTLHPDAAALYAAARLIVKVKEPLAGDLALLREDHLLFCFLHLAAAPELARQLTAIGLTAVAFETVEEDGALPILAPMSDIAGRLSVQIGTHLLHRPLGGRGVLLGGVAGTARARVVILGGGEAGFHAATLAAAIGAEVILFELRRERQERARRIADNVTALYPYSETIGNEIAQADLLIGAVLLPGRRAPRLVSTAQVAAMAAGAVVVDISVDQGGCIETTRPTSYDAPTYVDQGVLHFGVTNMPGAVPRTASQALSAIVTPYLLRLVEPDWRTDAALAGAINVAEGEIVHPVLREELVG